MFFKNCPFCNKNVHYMFDVKTNMYHVSCLFCKAKDIEIEASNKSLENLQKVWNSRPFESVILKNPSYAVKILKFFSGKIKSSKQIKEITSSHEFKDYDMLSNNDIGFLGYLITPKAEALSCEDSHLDSLFSYLKIDPSESFLKNFDLDQYCISNGFIRLSFHAKSLCISFNLSIVNRRQIDKLISLIEDPRLKPIKSFSLFVHSNNKKSTAIFNFSDLADLILELDKFNHAFKVMPILQQQSPFDRR